MRKKDIIEGVVDHVEFPNKGTFSYEDRTITVKGVIEGQKIRGQVTKKTQEWRTGPSAGSAGAVKTGRCAAGM